MLKIKPLTRKIILVSADTQAELNMAFLRLEEYYESPEWQGKIFTLGQYRKWYAETYGAFSYTTDWTGFNIPSAAFKPFIQGLFDPLTPNEQILVDWVRDRTDTFAMIGTQPDGRALEHEICHALWATEDSYRYECEQLVMFQQGPNFDQLIKMLGEMGYNESVFLDEMHAYISADREWLMEKKGIFIEPELQVRLQEIKKRYYTKK